jgi:hypothetical protein
MKPSNNYLDINMFKKKRIDIIWHKLDKKKYIDLYNNFNKNLSTPDFVMNINSDV